MSATDSEKARNSGRIHLGISGRVPSEGVADLRRNQWPAWVGIRTAQCGGRPCIRGMRIRVKDILDLLAAGMSPETILKDYPYLEKEDIQATLEFAAAQSDHVMLRAG